MPAVLARRSSSQSPDCCWRAQGEGWSDIRSSTSVCRAASTPSVAVSNLHSVFCTADARGGVDTGADVDHADAADADRVFVLLVAEGGDGDAVHARGIEDGGAGGDGHGKAVDGEGDIGGGFGGHGLEKLFTDAETRGNCLGGIGMCDKKKRSTI